MVNFEIKTHKSYEGNDLLDGVEIKQGNTVRQFEYREDELLKTVDDTDINPMNCRKSHSQDVILPQDCYLDVEIITPEPQISVEVSDRHLTGGDFKVEYSAWMFESRLSFENWIERNNLKVCNE